MIYLHDGGNECLNVVSMIVVIDFISLQIKELWQYNGSRLIMIDNFILQSLYSQIRQIDTILI